MPSVGRQRHTSGFTLLEVLISIVILSIGLLGLAGLQATSLQANQNAHYTSQANLLAYDIVDRMRANRQAARSGAYNIAIGSNLPTGSTQAAQDLRRWGELMGELLPQDLSGNEEAEETGPTGPVVFGSVNVDGDGIVTVVVQWFDGRARDEDDRVRQTTLRTQL